MGVGTWEGIIARKNARLRFWTVSDPGAEPLLGGIQDSPRGRLPEKNARLVPDLGRGERAGPSSEPVKARSPCLEWAKNCDRPQQERCCDTAGGQEQPTPACQSGPGDRQEGQRSDEPQLRPAALGEKKGHDLKGEKGPMDREVKAVARGRAGGASRKVMKAPDGHENRRPQIASEIDRVPRERIDPPNRDALMIVPGPLQ